MTLPAGQQRVLDGIAGTLQARDPRLASLFSIFTRLTGQEPMPRAEELPARRRPALPARPGRRVLRRSGRSAARLRAIVIVPVVLTAIACVLLLGSLAGSQRTCGPPNGTRVSPQPLGRVSICASAPAGHAAQHSLR